MKKQSHTVPRRRQSASPASRHLPLVDILIDAQAELQELVIASGLRVLEAMLEEDRAAVCGPRYAHQPARHAYRAGHAHGHPLGDAGPNEIAGRRAATVMEHRDDLCEDGMTRRLETLDHHPGFTPLPVGCLENTRPREHLNRQYSFRGCLGDNWPSFSAGVECWNCGSERPDQQLRVTGLPEDLTEK